MNMRIPSSLAVLLAIPACATTLPVPVDPSPYASNGTPVAFGEWVWLNEPYLAISPQSLLEDSRCPPNARCIWAGEVRMIVRISHDPEPEALYFHDNAMTAETELGSKDGLWILGGQIDVERVVPSPGMTGETLEPQDYRFTFRFTPEAEPN